MNDVNNRIFREFTEFFDNVEKSASEISVTMAYEITTADDRDCQRWKRKMGVGQSAMAMGRRGLLNVEL